VAGPYPLIDRIPTDTVIKFNQVAIIGVAFALLVWSMLSDSAPTHVDISKLQVADSFSLPANEDDRHIFVFESIDCTYCAKMHPELAKLRGVTVHIFPLPGHSERARAMAEAAWCAPDPASAWVAAYSGTVPPKSEQCVGTVLDHNLALAKSLGLQATPAIIFADGRVLQGFQTAEQLQSKLLNDPLAK